MLLVLYVFLLTLLFLYGALWGHVRCNCMHVVLFTLHCKQIWCRVGAHYTEAISFPQQRSTQMSWHGQNQTNKRNTYRSTTCRSTRASHLQLYKHSWTFSGSLCCKRKEGIKLKCSLFLPIPRLATCLGIGMGGIDDVSIGWGPLSPGGWWGGGMALLFWLMPMLGWLSSWAW